MNSFLLWLRGFDDFFFHKINQEWTAPWLDRVMPRLTDLHKIPLVSYGIIPGVALFWIYRKRGAALKTMLGLALAIGISDFVSYRFIKPLARRPRPEQAGISVVLRTNSLYGYSFPSNHAANSFAAATFMSSVYPGWRLAFYAAAALIAYSRVYVGVHFPFDAIGGAIIGILIGWMVARFWKGKKKGSRRASSSRGT